jgi:crotonobetainyl-CoA:carnitine CoA-transferase CaiB-like acyl-CoA transferase
MLLADLGAEVIKIENPADGGDMARAVGPHFLPDGSSQFFHAFNRNKRSLTLDLKTDAGKDIFHRLAAHADAVLNNLRGDLPETLGLDYAALGPLNPAIVCATRPSSAPICRPMAARGRAAPGRATTT